MARPRKEMKAPLLDAAAARYHTQGVKEVPSSLAHWRKKIGVETTCVEIKFQAPHAIDATLSRYLRQHNLIHWLISTQVLTWKIIVCLIQASFETPHLA